MTLGVVIVTHNSAKTIQAAVASVLRIGVRDIVVVDSASSDATKDIVTQQECDFIQLSTNRGFSVAANIGAAKISTDTILFLNPDAYITQGAMEAMIETLSSDSHIGVVGGLLVDAQDVAERYGYGRLLGPLEIVWRHFRAEKTLNIPTPVGWVSGGALMVRRSIFQNIGGFDEEFFLYWEDVDLCRRVHLAGYTVYIDPRARVVHVRGLSSVDQMKKTALYDASATRYFQKYYPLILCHLQTTLRRIYRALRPLVY
jgi:N-acetylglucosaminyl-diphospho-decaprenol L-rhamnosyltransferase